MSGAQPVVRCPEMPRSNSLFGGANLVSRGGPCVAVDPPRPTRVRGGRGGGCSRSCSQWLCLCDCVLSNTYIIIHGT